MNTVLGNIAWPAVVIVLAVIGSVTYLGSQGIMAASDITTIIVLILGAVGITATAHVTANAVTNAVTIPPPTGSTEKLV